MFFFFFFIEFRKNVLEILRKADINYDTDETTDDIVFGVRNSISYIIKIKEYTMLEVSFDTINDAVEELMTKAELFGKENKLVLIVSCVLDEKIRKQLQVLYPNIKTHGDRSKKHQVKFLLKFHKQMFLSISKKYLQNLYLYSII